jgi:hypothetical protein
MALDRIRDEVGLMLADIDKRLAEADRLLSQGTLRQKVDAAGELAFLHVQKQMVDARLKQVDAVRPDAAETPLRWMKEEVFNLKLRLEQWLGGA